MIILLTKNREKLANRYYMEKPTPILKVYRGFASKKETHIFGHVLQTVAPQREKITRNPFRNALGMLRRYRVRPAKNEVVVVKINNKLYEERIDSKGFFMFRVPTFGCERFWVELQLKDHPEEFEQFELEVKDPPNIIVSDIDDTVLVSHSTSLLKKLYLLLTKNYKRRKVFNGIRDFYSRLGGVDNEFFYVSSSEWNLYDFLNDFMAFNRLPNGVFLLQDIKSGLRDIFRSGGGSHQHKYHKIKMLLEVYPQSKFLLVGDSGQRDPFIYQQIAEEHPDRIQKIYIRDVRSSRRVSVRSVAEKLKEVGVSLEIFDDSRSTF